MLRKSWVFGDPLSNVIAGYEHMLFNVLSATIFKVFSATVLIY